VTWEGEKKKSRYVFGIVMMIRKYAKSRGEKKPKRNPEIGKRGGTGLAKGEDRNLRRVWTLNVGKGVEEEKKGEAVLSGTT